MSKTAPISDLSSITTVVVPVRDEARTIGKALESLGVQSIGTRRIEVLVVDGQSTDGTREICEGFRERFEWANFEVLETPARTVPKALNIGLAAARGAWFTRLDGRTRFSANYLERCTEAAELLGSADAVGGIFVIESAPGRRAASIAAAVSHPIGVGRGFRTLRPNEPAAITHHPFAVWPTHFVQRVGGFREELTRNQDDEFSARALAAGGRLSLIPGAKVFYRPRDRYSGLAVQYFQYGLWKGAVGRNYGVFPTSLPRSNSRSDRPNGASARGCPEEISQSRRRSSRLLPRGGVGWRSREDRPGATTALTAAALGVVHGAYGVGVGLGLTKPDIANGPWAAHECVRAHREKRKRRHFSYAAGLTCFAHCLTRQEVARRAQATVSRSTYLPAVSGDVERHTV